MSLYDPVLMRHARKPYGFGRPDGGQVVASSCDTNRPCGDRVCFHVVASEGGDGADTLTVRFEGEGCALALGAASALCEVVDQRSRKDALVLVETYTKALSEPAIDGELPGDLAHFARARAFPARVACVTLGSAVLLSALERSALGGGSDDRRDAHRPDER